MTTQQIRDAQHAWAQRQGIELRDPGHTLRLEDIEGLNQPACDLTWRLITANPRVIERLAAH